MSSVIFIHPCYPMGSSIELLFLLPWIVIQLCLPVKFSICCCSIALSQYYYVLMLSLAVTAAPTTQTVSLVVACLHWLSLLLLLPRLFFLHWHAFSRCHCCSYPDCLLSWHAFSGCHCCSYPVFLLSWHDLLWSCIGASSLGNVWSSIWKNLNCARSQTLSLIIMCMLIYKKNFKPAVNCHLALVKLHVHASVNIGGKWGW